MCEETFEFDDSKESNLFNDLLIVKYWNQRLNEKFPVIFNHLLQGGYFNMPSARMSQEGEASLLYWNTTPFLIKMKQSKNIQKEG